MYGVFDANVAQTMPKGVRGRHGTAKAIANPLGPCVLRTRQPRCHRSRCWLFGEVGVLNGDRCECGSRGQLNRKQRWASIRISPPPRRDAPYCLTPPPEMTDLIGGGPDRIPPLSFGL